MRNGLRHRRVMITGVFFLFIGNSEGQTLAPYNQHNSFVSYASTVRNAITEWPARRLHMEQFSSTPSLEETYNGGGPSLFGNFGNNILDSFRGNNVYFHLSAVAATAALVSSGADYSVEHYFNQHQEFGPWARPVVWSGQFLPFIAGGSLFAYAKIKNDDKVLGASYAVMEASVIEFLYNSTLKAITGRPNPNWRQVSDMDSLSKTFRLGFLRGGIFWGWPSGHTAATMAVVSALTSYYPNNTWLKIGGFGLVAYTMFGVAANNRGGMHWLSDAVAGALMSYAVGSTVGKYYRNIYSRKMQSIPSADNTAGGFNPSNITFSFQF
ncbi:MAG TPA: phosphatase PAP2 family protein [Bacteroidota bacterium]|nr:phosphatase PAP2 family protein [Bacteroidota bacterium]